MLIVKVILLIALLRVLVITEKPVLCAGIYAGVGLILSLFLGFGLMGSLVGALVGFILSFIYFWLLNKYNHGPAYFIILIIGLGIGLV